ncbi:BMP family lipoprotein [Oceanirhabdus seepicola]|uniref:BMP family ABC transporter substrate-binding protein n=1 Tax=Oceanirhabdus seepicola TaxID=2828781 RepID=A0A9J6NWL5_9CLOT|nr:BMP family ABC transporter substrate-binding protein [Oceanirhabdus seepicola]MCM1988444.1 BMP family ABC transporter substrate-binding protein [Oceanirhabdus seepicola]
MKLKKIFAILISVMLLISLVSCKTEGNKEGNKNEGDKAKQYYVGLVTDEGGINDKSFNQSANEGALRAKDEFGIQYKAIESSSKEDYEENLETLVDDGADLVFGVGFQMAESLKNVAQKYPDNKFVIIDSSVDLPNVQSVSFKEHEGSFLVGVIAGKMSKANKIGFIGGKDFELINRFEVGFAAGVMSVNPEAGKLLMNRKTVKYADSFSDVNKGYELGKALIDEGCDVLYHAAGGVGIGMFTIVDETVKGGKEAYAIGVDMDQSETLPKYKDVIISSMIKRVDTGTYTAIKDLAGEKFEGGKIVELGLAEDGVGIADTTKDKVDSEIMTLVEKYRGMIVDGNIKVPSSLDELKTFEAPEV